MKYMVALLLMFACCYLCSGNHECRGSGAFCCTTGTRWCTENIYMVMDSNKQPQCRCDFGCPKQPEGGADMYDDTMYCCDDQKLWCGKLRQLMLENEIEIQRRYMDVAERELIAEERALAEKDTVESEKEELLSLLAKLLNDKP